MAATLRVAGRLIEGVTIRRYTTFFTRSRSRYLQVLKEARGFGRVEGCFVMPVWKPLRSRPGWPDATAPHGYRKYRFLFVRPPASRWIPSCSDRKQARKFHPQNTATRRLSAGLGHPEGIHVDALHRLADPACRSAAKFKFVSWQG